MENALQKTALMLILNVKTQWSLTHQMLRKQSCLIPILQLLTSYIPGWALDYCDAIDNFVAKNRELRAYELSTADWDAITLVTQWLKSFRSATTQMSATKSSMLSTTHAIFHGLQEDIRHSLTKLPMLHFTIEDITYEGSPKTQWLLYQA